MLAVAVLLAPAALACGGGGESGEAERRYLRDVCAAGAQLNGEDLRAAEAAEVTEDTPRELLVLVKEALDGALAHLRGATPPSGVAEYHAALVLQYEELAALAAEALAALDEGDDAARELFASLTSLQRLPELAPETWERLVRAARDVPECSGATSLLGFLGAGVEPPEGGAPAADEAYARDICVAGSAYHDAVVEELVDGNVDVSDPEELLEATGRTLAVLTAALDDISAPDGLVEHHETTLVYFKYFVLAMGGDNGFSYEDLQRLQAVSEEGLAQPIPPPDVRVRIEQAAIGVPECYGSGFLLTFLGEGR